ncbi:hypothetical protein NHX12_019639 [Muraenolepis orangiensis]|uniref:C2 domain-containing protein n=1 Tax=Muraenolepis orangiensis TaxID=630683 RepID=A0A9Q0IWT1_9TELE|nr:hypothetical protein NHX12_019639 [Muraenolepis orangiensis]
MSSPVNPVADDEAPEPQRWVPTHVQVTVMRAHGLRGKGKGGASDAYTIIQVGREKYSTRVVERSTAPEWGEECTFELLPGVLEGREGDLLLPPGEGSVATGSGSGPPASGDLVLTVMHRALIGLDVFLGQAVIPLDRAFRDNVYARNE